MKKVWILLLILPLTCVCSAQSTQLGDLHFNHLSIKDGLPEGVIQVSLQDKEGYIWIGTQAGLVRYDGYSTKVYQFEIEDPLKASIRSLYEDRSGELWVGTMYEGLYHYNRTADTFIHYKHNSKDANSISEGIITSIKNDSNGNLWLISYDYENNFYVNLFDTKNHQFKHFGILEKGNHHINASSYDNLFEDSKGHIWVGTNNGVYEYTAAGDKFIPHFASADTEQQKIFSHLTEDATNPGIIWMDVIDPKLSKGEGVRRYNTADNTVKAYHHIFSDSTSLGSDSVTAIQKDSHNRLWFGSDNGLSFFDAPSESFINYKTKYKKTDPWWFNAIWGFIEDKAGNFWCFFGYNNFVFFDAKTKSFTPNTANAKDLDALPATGISHLLVDRSGTIWVGTAPQGLYWLNRNRTKFLKYKDDPGTPHYFPGGSSASFAEDKDGTFWVWSSNGLYHWYPSSDSFTLIRPLKDQLGKDNPWHISSILIDRKGIVWCSSYGNGLFSYDPAIGKIKNFKNNPKDSTSLSSDKINTLFEDEKGSLWIGTHEGGLCSFNKHSGIFKRYPFIWNGNNYSPDNHTLNDGIIYTICEDKHGELWLGTNNGGVNRFNRETGTFTSYKNQSPGLTITKIFEDSKGNIWVGTHASGLFLFDRNNNTFKKFTENDGLLYNGVIGINEDNANNLWVTSSRGISILNLQTNKISRLAAINGLPEEPDYNNILFKTSQGSFFMPCNNGFISFNTDELLKPDTTLPVVHIESIEFIKPQIQGNKQTDSIIYSYGKNEINLRYNENRITFNYVGLQYQNSALNQYAYKLDGYDKDWISAGAQRKVTYTNLSPGTYTFHVKAANSDGVWNEQEQTLIVIISPPWWLTWWAYLLYAIAFAAAVWAFVAYRARSLKHENILLEEKITRRTSQLKASLEDLKSTQSQLIQKEKMASLGELTAGIAHEIQNPLNFVNNFSEVNTELIEELKNEKLKVKSERNERLETELLNDIAENSEKINHHGKRADAIVKSMLQHSQSGGRIKEPTDINAVADEYLRLSYHGLRAKDKSFNVIMQTDFDESIGKINIIPQDIGRVLLNLYNNAFYAVSEKQKAESLKQKAYEPAVSISTKKIGDKVLISVKDNGPGVPQKIVDKIFQPFFTTKPTGQGTGLGLSLSYDIIKAHGGEIKVESKESEGAEFIIQLPSG